MRAVLAKILLAFGGFILAGLMLWGIVAWRDRAMLKQLRAEMGIARRDTVIRVLDSTRVVLDTIYLRSKATHAEVVKNPGSTKSDVVRSCQQLILSCDALRAVNDSLRDSLKAQVSDLKDMKERKPSRLSAYVLGGYDWMAGKPLAQVGGDARIAGPFSVTGFVEAAKGDDTEKIKARGVIAAKFTFR